MVLLEIFSSLKQDKSLPQFLLSKSFTLPVLLFVLYKIIWDEPISKKELITEESNTIKSNSTKDSQQKSTTEALSQHNDQYGSLGVPIEAESSDFDWSTSYPIKYRPFKKGPYKLVMGIHNIPPSEWFLVESTYKEYTDLKWSYISDPELFDHNIFLDDDAIDAAIEFYTMSTEFMLKRYPMCFEIRGDQIYNKIRDDYIPLKPESVKDPKQLIVYLGRFLEEDFILMKQDPENYETDEYYFQGGCFAFAAGFDPAVRFRLPMTGIHGPVPEYKTKLRPQMNKFFDKLKPYSYVRRNNWSIQTHNKVFVMNANKGLEDDEMMAIDPDTLDFKREVYFRSERQILTKLPKTGIIVFSIRTYLTPMSDIREEATKEELIGGIEDMQETIGQYKKKPEWGPPVIKFLKGESDGCDKPWIKGLE